MFKNEFVKFEERLYIVKKIIKEEYNPNLEAWKLMTGSDIVLKRNDLLYFVEEVPDLDILEDFK